MTALMFCTSPLCVAPADGRVLLDDIAGSIEYDGNCRDHLIAARADLENRYRSSRVAIAWASCQRCGGEGHNDGEACPDCRDLTDQGGPLRFGDMVHESLLLTHGKTAMVVTQLLAPGHDFLGVILDPWPDMLTWTPLTRCTPQCQEGATL